MKKMKTLWIFGAASLVALAVTLAGLIEPAGPSPAGDALKGLWARDLPGSSVRFYYFHGDGNGLYRYGRIAFTNTNSYDYAADGGTLKLKFRKTGERAEVPFRVEGQGDARVLILENDPRENGETHRYRFVPVDAVEHPRAADPRPPSGRMWIHLNQFATGGMAFSMYQLTPAGIDGRGTGWHHRGDFNDWSTEALTYRMRGDLLELTFELTGEQYRTPFRVDGDKERTLKLLHDPRNWWQRSAFVDMGRSFSVDEMARFSLDPRAP